MSTYDGWAPVVGSPVAFKSDVAALHQLARERGRNPASLQLNAFVSPGEDGVALEDLKLYREAGADRVILFSQRDAIKMAAGRALEVIKRVAVTVERAQHV